MIINGTTVADPTFEGITVTDKIEWAPNAGRSLANKRVGDIKGIKQVINVEWEVLTYADFEAIRTAVINGTLNGGYFSITFPKGASTDTKTVYVEEIPRTFYSPCKQPYYKGVKITFTEQ